MKKFMVMAGVVVCLAAFACQSKNTSQKETAGQQTVATDGYYTCTMHPLIQKPEPGTCPVCGMTLVFKKNDLDTTKK